MNPDKIKGAQFRRQAVIEKTDPVDDETRSVNVAISSEAPVMREFGLEILDHDARSIDLGRLNDRAPLLIGHNHEDQVGVVEKVDIGADRVARAVVRFGRSARAEEIYQDVKDGIRSKISIGYVINQLVEDDSSTSQNPAWRATSWCPYEVSLVSIPADNSVGVGRSGLIENSQKSEKTAMSQDKQQPADAEKSVREQPAPMVDVKAEIENVRKAELARIDAIEKMAREFGMDDLGRRYINDGKTVDQFNSALLAEVRKNSGGKFTPGDADIGMSDHEIRQYSFIRLINALANPTSRSAQQAAAYEFEVSGAAAERAGKEPEGVMIPSDVLRAKRDMTVGTATAGGHTVATELLADSFIDSLENAMKVRQAGATMLTGLVGNVAIPRQTSGATAYWVAESGSPTESQAAFDQVTLSPKTVGAFSDISRKLLLQSSIDIEAFVRNELALRLALAIDLAAINGSGASNQPTGILNTSGIGDVAGGTNGLAPTWSHIVNIKKEVAKDNAMMGSLGWLLNSDTVGKLQTVEKASSTAQFILGEEAARLAGFPVYETNQVPNNLDKGTSTGVCSALIFGNWADLIIGMWGGLDINVDTSTGSTSGTVRVVALQDVDIAVRHAQSFSAMLDALTA